MNKSSLIVSVVIALLGIFVGLYFAKNANDELMAYRAEQQDVLLSEQNEIGEKAEVSEEKDSVEHFEVSDTIQ